MIPTPVAVDAMGADFGSEVAVNGVVQAARELGIASVIVGLEDELNQHLRKLGADRDPLIKVRNATDVITMDDSPSAAIRGKPDSSMRVAFELVKQGEACAVVSPGNTGAMMAAGLFVSGTISGIARPAIATLIPKVRSGTPTVLLDSGANVDCHAHQMVQFALMGSCYARSAIGCVSPRLALLSNGTEISKGNDIVRSAALALSEIPEINFIGYVEGRDISRDVVDVVVCDGFVGNILLKAMEGSVELVFDSIKYQAERNWRGRLGMWLAKPMFKQLFREKLDPSAYGGAPLLGLNHIAIVCHGSANSRAIMNGVRVAKKFSDENLISKMGKALAHMDLKFSSDYESGLWNRVGQRFEKKKARAKAEQIETESDLPEIGNTTQEAEGE